MKPNIEKKQLLPTHATSDLGNWLNLKLVLYLEVLANQKNNDNLGPNRVARERYTQLKLMFYII